MKSDIDRDLLIGLLAYQNCFIERSGLIDAFREWCLNPSEKFSQYLIDRKIIDAAVITRIEQLIEIKQLTDQELSGFSALFSSMSGLTDEIIQIAEKAGAKQVNDSLRTFLQTEPYNRNPKIESVSGHSVGHNRFQIIKKHAQGGLGVVYVAEDRDFQRQVAVKQIRSDRADDPNYREKFEFEATVTGSLEHPGIVPMYAWGTDSQNRPYYAMRLIRGEGLNAHIAMFHESTAGAKRSRWRSSQFRQLLRRLIDVCNAMEYAHQCGVLHRDLKPGNIMVGKYGETLVVDWGIAKSMSSHGSQAESHRDRLQSISAPKGSETVYGAFLGTASYAPPEQLRGELNALGPHSDVFSLGAILFEILTGKPPIQKAKSIADVLRQLEVNATGGPGAIDSSVPLALQEITRKAMAISPELRYRSAAEFAADIECWLADESTTAYREGFFARMLRYVRKNPARFSTASVALLIGGISLVGFNLVSANHLTVVRGLNADLSERNIRLEESNQTEAAARSKAEFAFNTLNSALRSPDPDRSTGAKTVLEILAELEQEMRSSTTELGDSSGVLWRSLAETYLSLGLGKEAIRALQMQTTVNLNETDSILLLPKDLQFLYIQALGESGQYLSARQAIDRLYGRTAGNAEARLAGEDSLANFTIDQKRTIEAIYVEAVDATTLRSLPLLRQWCQRYLGDPPDSYFIAVDFQSPMPLQATFNYSLNDFREPTIDYLMEVQKRFGTSSRESVFLVVRAAIFLYLREEKQQALDILGRVEHAVRNKYGENSPRLARILWITGSMLLAIPNRSPEGLRYARSAVATYASTLGEESPQTLTAAETLVLATGGTDARGLTPVIHRALRNRYSLPMESELTDVHSSILREFNQRILGRPLPATNTDAPLSIAAPPKTPPVSFEADLEREQEKLAKLINDPSSQSGVVLYVDSEVPYDTLPQGYIKYRCYSDNAGNGGYSGEVIVPLRKAFGKIEHVASSMASDDGKRRIVLDPGPPYEDQVIEIRLEPGKTTSLGRIELKKSTGDGTAVIYGVVRELAGEPVTDVVISDGNQQVSSDSVGRFEIGDYPIDMIALTTSKAGYFSEKTYVAIRNMNERRIDKTLWLYRPMKIQLKYAIHSATRDTLVGEDVEAGVLVFEIHQNNLSMEPLIMDSPRFQTFAKKIRLRTVFRDGTLRIEAGVGPVNYHWLQSADDWDQITVASDQRSGVYTSPDIKAGATWTVCGYSSPDRSTGEKYSAKFRVEKAEYIEVSR